MEERQGTPTPATTLERLRERPFHVRFRIATWRFIRGKPLGAWGAAIVIVMVFMAILAPYVAPYNPVELNPKMKLSAPSPQFWLGTDELGRDLFSRIIWGSRSALQTGFFVLFFGTAVGVIIGITTGYFGGKYDLVMQRVMDATMAFPMLILAMAIVAMLGASFFNVVIAISIVIIPGTSRVLRGTTLSVKENQYIEAARAMGASNLRILVNHIFPNVFAPIIILASVQLGSIILTEASLSFLGLGTPPPTPTWGGMLSGSGRRFMEIAPWMAIFPGVAISLVVLGFNLFGDALRDVLDPRLRGSR